MSDVPDFTPVFLLTGFLGSGKTTLLARLLKHPDLSDSAVLINEFGEVGLDHHLLDRIDDTMVLLKSGCLCCTIRGELASAIRALYSKRARGIVPPFRRLIIETTGLADPLPALTTITADPVLRHHFRIGAVLATVDAVNGLKQLATQPESVKQAAIADRLVLTKTDICDEAAVTSVVEALRAINPDAPLLNASTDDLDPAAILGERPALPSVLGGMHCVEVSEDTRSIATRQHGEIGSFVVEIEEAMDWTLFALWLTMLLNRHGELILRVKGLLNVAGSQTPVAIHGVQQLVHVPTHLSAWPDGDRRSRIVFITRGIGAGPIARSLRAFGVITAERPGVPA